MVVEVGRVAISTELINIFESIPAVAALGPGRVWQREAPGDTAFPVIVFNQIGLGRGIAPIGGQVIAANYRYQWRVATKGGSIGPVIDIARAIHAALQRVMVTTTNGDALTIRTVITDLPEIPVDDSGRTMEELGGEIEVHVDWNVSP
jgi:hypothetical protein